MLSRNGLLREIQSGNVLILPFEQKNLGPNTCDVTLEGYNWQLSSVIAPQFLGIFKGFLTGQARSPPGGIYINIGKYIGLTSSSSSTFSVIDPYDEQNYLMWKLRAPLDMENTHDRKYLRNFLSERSWENHFRIKSKIILVHPNDHLLCYSKEFMGGVNDVYGLMSCRSTVRRVGLTMCCCAGTGDVGYINRWAHEVVSTLKDRTILMVVGNRYSQLQFPTTTEKQPDLYDVESNFQYGINSGNCTTTKQETGENSSVHSPNANLSKYQSISGNPKNGIEDLSIRQLIHDWNFFKFLPKKFLDREFTSKIMEEKQKKPPTHDGTNAKHIISNTLELRTATNDDSQTQKPSRHSDAPPLSSSSSAAPSSQKQNPSSVSFDDIAKSQCFLPKMLIYLKYIRGALAEITDLSNTQFHNSINPVNTPVNPQKTTIEKTGSDKNREVLLTGSSVDDLVDNKANESGVKHRITRSPSSSSSTSSSQITSGSSNIENKPSDNSREGSPRKALPNNNTQETKSRSILGTLAYIASFVVSDPDNQGYSKDVETATHSEKYDLPESHVHLNTEKMEEEEQEEEENDLSQQYNNDHNSKNRYKLRLFPNSGWIYFHKKHKDKLISEKKYYLLQLQQDETPLFWESGISITFDDIAKAKKGNDSDNKITNSLSSFSQFCYLATLVQYNKLNIHIAHIDYLFANLMGFLKENTNLDLHDHNIHRQTKESALNQGSSAVLSHDNNKDTTSTSLGTNNSKSGNSFQSTLTETESLSIDFYHEYDDEESDQEHIIPLQATYTDDHMRNLFLVSMDQLPVPLDVKVSDFHKFKKMYLYAERWSNYGNNGTFNSDFVEEQNRFDDEDDEDDIPFRNDDEDDDYDNNNTINHNQKSINWVKSDDAVDGCTLIHSFWKEDLSINRYRSPGVMSDLIKRIKEKKHKKKQQVTSTYIANYIVTILVKEQIDNLVSFYKNMDYSPKNAESSLSSQVYARNLLNAYFNIQAILDIILKDDKSKSPQIDLSDNGKYFQKIPHVSQSCINTWVKTLQDQVSKKSFTQSTFDYIKILEESSPVEKFYSQMIDICLEVYLFTHFVEISEKNQDDDDENDNS